MVKLNLIFEIVQREIVLIVLISTRTNSPNLVILYLILPKEKQTPWQELQQKKEHKKNKV